MKITTTATNFILLLKKRPLAFSQLPNTDFKSIYNSNVAWLLWIIVPLRKLCGCRGSQLWGRCSAAKQSGKACGHRWFPQPHQRGKKLRKLLRYLSALIKGAPRGSAGWSENSVTSQQPETWGDGTCRRGARRSFSLRAPSGEPERGEAAVAASSTQRRVLFLSRLMLHRWETFRPPSLFTAMTDGLICFSQEGDANTLTAVIKSACEA